MNKSLQFFLILFSIVCLSTNVYAGLHDNKDKQESNSSSPRAKRVKLSNQVTNEEPEKPKKHQQPRYPREVLERVGTFIPDKFVVHEKGSLKQIMPRRAVKLCAKHVFNALDRFQWEFKNSYDFFFEDRVKFTSKEKPRLFIEGINFLKAKLLWAWVSADPQKLLPNSHATLLHNPNLVAMDSFFKPEEIKAVAQSVLSSLKNKPETISAQGKVEPTVRVMASILLGQAKLEDVLALENTTVNNELKFRLLRYAPDKLFMTEYAPVLRGVDKLKLTQATRGQVHLTHALRLYDFWKAKKMFKRTDKDFSQLKRNLLLRLSFLAKNSKMPPFLRQKAMILGANLLCKSTNPNEMSRAHELAQSLWNSNSPLRIRLQAMKILFNHSYKEKYPREEKTEETDIPFVRVDPYEPKWDLLADGASKFLSVLQRIPSLSEDLRNRTAVALNKINSEKGHDLDEAIMEFFSHPLPTYLNLAQEMLIFPFALLQAYIRYEQCVDALIDHVQGAIETIVKGNHSKRIKDKARRLGKMAQDIADGLVDDHIEDME